jgi:general secretion pathway protein G
LRARGFTLIEMVVVLAIVSLLALSAQPLHELALRRTQEIALRKALRDIRGALDEYRQAVLKKQVAAGRDGSAYPPSLRALVDGVQVLDEQGAPRAEQRLYLLRKLPRDPMADAALSAEDSWGLRASSSPPTAPAPGLDVFDVYSRSEARALDGTRYREW